MTLFLALYLQKYDSSLFFAPDNFLFACNKYVYSYKKQPNGYKCTYTPMVTPKIPPKRATIEEDPTPAFRTVVGMSSAIYSHSIANEAETENIIAFIRKRFKF